MPKIHQSQWINHDGVVNEHTGRDDGPWSEKVLGDVVGLTQFGVRMERVPPGSRTSTRHWHETEDEFVYILSGQLVLIEDSESVLQAGEAAGWCAGQPTAHCLENRSSEDATLLVIGTRKTRGVVHYPDFNVKMIHDAGGRRFEPTGASGPGSPTDRGDNNG